MSINFMLCYVTSIIIQISNVTLKRTIRHQTIIGGSFKQCLENEVPFDNCKNRRMKSQSKTPDIYKEELFLLVNL